jgi:hypothetical protein
MQLLALDFTEQKNTLLDKLSEYTSKLLFPKVLLYSVNKCGLTLLANFFKNYNYYLTELYDLEYKISKLNKFSYFNSWTVWNSRIASTINKLNIVKKELVYYILEKNNLNEYIYLFNKFNIKYECIVIFMLIKKSDNKYLIANREVSLTNIQRLLPTCIKYVSIDNIKDYFSEKIYQNTYQLDIKDCFTDETATQISEEAD